MCYMYAYEESKKQCLRYLTHTCFPDIAANVNAPIFNRNAKKNINFCVFSVLKVINFSLKFPHIIFMTSKSK